MKLENQVCALHQAKRLTELGVVNKSFLIHAVYQLCPFRSTIVIQKGVLVEGIEVFYYPAFSVAELGVMLCDKTSELLKLIRLKEISHLTEAEARAELLIHCIETKKIPVELINKAIAA